MPSTARSRIGVEQLRRVSAAALLGAVHRGVGVLDQTLAHPCFARVGEREPDAGAETQLGAARRDRLRERALQPVGHADGLEHAADGLAEHRELVAAEAGDRVLRAERALEPARHLAQHLVPSSVAEAVVDALEAVEVDEVDGGDARLGAPPERVAQAVGEECAVGKSGQRVVESEPLELDSMRLRSLTSRKTP